MIEKPTNSTLKANISESMVTLTVSDTGQGMSPSFLRDRLYKPFSQESSLAVGTGLGLSIVHQIAKAMGGSIDIKSQLGAGTTAKVCTPLQEVTAKDLDTTMDRVEGKIRSRPAPVTVCLIGFDIFPGSRKSPSGRETVQERQMKVLAVFLKKSLKSWFGVTVSKSPSFDSASADILVVARSQLQTLHESETKTGPRNDLVTPLIILYDQVSDILLSRYTGQGIVKLHHP